MYDEWSNGQIEEVITDKSVWLMLLSVARFIPELGLVPVSSRLWSGLFQVRQSQAECGN